MISFFFKTSKKKWKPKKRERSGWEVNLYPSTRRRKCRLNSLIFVWERISSQLVDLKQSTISFLHKIGCHQFIDNYSTCVQARENFTRWWRNHFKLRKLHVWNKSTAGAIYKLKTWKKPKKTKTWKMIFFNVEKIQWKEDWWQETLRTITRRDLLNVKILFIARKLETGIKHLINICWETIEWEFALPRSRLEKKRVK